MRLLIDDALAAASFTQAHKAGWLDSPPDDVSTVVRPNLTAGDVGPEDVALIPSAAIPALRETHRIAPDAAVVFGETGTVAMRCPVRPDAIERTPVRLWGTSSFGEALARATIFPFYGIRPERWTTEDQPAAQAVVVEGPEALRPPEAGFSEDLSRAWFILTGQPAVGHVLVVPKSAERGDLAPALTTVAALREAGVARRRDLRRDLAEAHGLPLDRLNALFAPMRYALDRTDRTALLMLLQRGHTDAGAAAARALEFLEPGEESAGSGSPG